MPKNKCINCTCKIEQYDEILQVIKRLKLIDKQMKNTFDINVKFNLKSKLDRLMGELMSFPNKGKEEISTSGNVINFNAKRRYLANRIN